ncbi:MAG: AAA family ATPase, partial [Thiotrichales bacterium]|nr:AAA family ATPase [Thiotrichales bacterium]
TQLIHTLSEALNLEFKRIQFTPDMMPSDVTGTTLLIEDERGGRQLEFQQGPIFAQLILADEINRATPRTQSALLESMEEHQVTIEGETRSLPKPFFVIATQNPSHQVGTYPLPESQLDRFTMRIELGYPDKVAERELFQGADRREMIDAMDAELSPLQLLALQKQAETIHVSDALLGYLEDLLAFSRESHLFVHGLSPRAGLAIMQSARAWSLLMNRSEVLPEDLQAILPSVVGHRLALGEESSRSPGDSARLLIENVPIS